VLWALVRSVGLYPAGSILLAESGYILLSLSPNPKDLRRPNCRVLVRPDGTPEPEENPTLWEPMPSTDRVVQVLRPEHYQKSGEMLAAA
jgi:hypothetical protein